MQKSKKVSKDSVIKNLRSQLSDMTEKVDVMGKEREFVIKAFFKDSYRMSLHDCAIEYLKVVNRLSNYEGSISAERMTIDILHRDKKDLIEMFRWTLNKDTTQYPFSPNPLLLKSKVGADKCENCGCDFNGTGEVGRNRCINCGHRQGRTY